MTIGITTGRKAPKEDRARAAGLVASYFRGLSSPDSRYCINPEDEPEFQIFVEEADVDSLLVALQSFAEHGTFALMSDIKPFVMRFEMSELLGAGMTTESAIAQLSEKHNMSFTSARRRVKRKVKTLESQRGVFRPNANRLSRHWYDLSMLADMDIGQAALGKRDLLVDVVKHKKVFLPHQLRQL